MKKFTGLILASLLLLSVCSCNKKESKPDDARYAIYELAKANEYNGTYEEWLDSIKGDKIELKVINDELKWKYSEEADSAFKTLVSLSTLKGKDGADGEDGKNAKEVKDISSIKVGDTTIFTFVFDDDTEIKAELVEKESTMLDVSSIDKEINAYKAFKFSSTSNYDDIYLDDPRQQLGKYNFRFVENESLVPYISLEEASKLYNKNLKNDTIKSSVEEVDGNSIWTIGSNNKIDVMVKIDPIEQEFMIEGSFENVYNGAIDHSKKSIMLQSQSETTVLNKAEANPKLYISYKETDFKAFKYDEVTYYPFGLINGVLQHYTGHRYFYNYTNIYEYDELKHLTQYEIFNKKDDELAFNVMSQMETYVDNHYLEKDASQNPLMPLYLRLNNRSEFTLEYEVFYGLQSVRNIKSMKDYYDVHGIYDAMIDDNSLIRGKAYARASFILEDQHTAKANTSRTPWGEDNGGRDINPAYASKLVEERSKLGKTLSEARKDVFKANGIEEDDYRNTILYSKDGLTAYFYFDSFEAADNAYNKDGSLKSDEKLAKEDSFYFFIQQLNAIKAHTTKVDGNDVKVKNVIIDDSQNSGGYVYILGKLLALLSKDNLGYFYLKNELTNEISKNTFRVDSNKDGVYDEKDCFGNDFDFYILTSNQSFSCGNALPYIASNIFNHVRIIGERSGGGECVVDTALLSNGIFYYHSGVEHLIIYDEKNKTVSGVEDGVAPGYTLLYSDFYNIEKLNEAIKKMVTRL